MPRFTTTFSTEITRISRKGAYLNKRRQCNKRIALRRFRDFIHTPRVSNDRRSGVLRWVDDDLAAGHKRICELKKKSHPVEAGKAQCPEAH